MKMVDLSKIEIKEMAKKHIKNGANYKLKFDMLDVLNNISTVKKSKTTKATKTNKNIFVGFIKSMCNDILNGINVIVDNPIQTLAIISLICGVLSVNSSLLASFFFLGLFIISMILTFMFL